MTNATIALSLTEMASPLSSLPTTITLSASRSGRQTSSFSMPPLLFYMMKARTLARLGVTDESKVALPESVRVAVLTDIRELAKHLSKEISAHNLQEKAQSHVSTILQEYMLLDMLEQPQPAVNRIKIEKAVAINASGSSKNITIPYYVYSQLLKLMADDKTVKGHIHGTVRNALAILNHPDVNKAEHSRSFSRKIHNILFLELLNLSNNSVVNGIRLDQVKMFRDEKLEKRGNDKKNKS